MFRRPLGSSTRGVRWFFDETTVKIDDLTRGEVVPAERIAFGAFWASYLRVN